MSKKKSPDFTIKEEGYINEAMKKKLDEIKAKKKKEKK